MTSMADITLEVFEKEAVDFLDSHAEKRPPERAFVWGEGSETPFGGEERSRDNELKGVELAKAWRQKKFDAGFGWVTGPRSLGGRELPAAYDRLYGQLEAQYRVPGQSCFGIGLGMVAPTILAHATDVAKELYLKKMWRGDIIGCQLFSEPGAGSDLASLTTKAERDGDEWIITGQKVWTSGAHYSDIGEVICRTDPSLPKHKGLTGFIVDMHDPNIEIRPLKQMNGGTGFNEVFFNEVRVRDDHRLGDVNNGWNVALTTLMNERASIGVNGGGSGGGDKAIFDRIVAMLRHYGLDSDPIVRNELADIWSRYKVASLTNTRAMAKVRAGQTPGPEMSIAKMALTANQTRLGAFVSKVLGAKIQADTGEWGTYAWGGLVLGTPGLRIAGGSDEVMRNIVGERVLGLPKDAGIDSNTPFNQMRVN